jgi:hypothetical protein
MESSDTKKNGRTSDTRAPKTEKFSRRDALKRMAKGIALVGTLGVTGVITQGQDECTGGYVNFTPHGYYNYSNAYYNYSDSYYNYNNAYYNYSNAYYNYYDTYYNYYDNYGYYNW